jgi:hypothetical protein
MDDRTKAALWRAFWSMAITAVAAGMTAVLTTPDVVTGILQGQLENRGFVALVGLVFFSGMLGALKKYFDVKL